MDYTAIYMPNIGGSATYDSESGSTSALYGKPLGRVNVECNMTPQVLVWIVMTEICSSKGNL